MLKKVLGKVVFYLDTIQAPGFTSGTICEKGECTYTFNRTLWTKWEQATTYSELLNMIYSSSICGQILLRVYDSVGNSRYISFGAFYFGSFHRLRRLNCFYVPHEKVGFKLMGISSHDDRLSFMCNQRSNGIRQVGIHEGDGDVRVGFTITVKCGNHT